MVKGIDVFREHFALHTNNYILIGGSACDLLFAEAGGAFRATKDLDIVLTIENLSPEFGAAMWSFVDNGKYTVSQKSDGQDCFYRFKSPATEGYPHMIELFSRNPGFELRPGSKATPIHWQAINDADAKSLSAILMSTAYYDFIHSGKLLIDGISTVGAPYLIPMKMRAWIDHLQRKEIGEKVDTKDIKKHRNDILRLSQLLTPGERYSIPDQIKADVTSALDILATEEIDLHNLGIKGALSEIVTVLNQSYLDVPENNGGGKNRP